MNLQALSSLNTFVRIAFAAILSLLLGPVDGATLRTLAIEAGTQAVHAVAAGSGLGSHPLGASAKTREAPSVGRRTVFIRSTGNGPDSAATGGAPALAGVRLWAHQARVGQGRAQSRSSRTPRAHGPRAPPLAA